MSGPVLMITGGTGRLGRVPLPYDRRKAHP